MFKNKRLPYFSPTVFHKVLNLPNELRKRLLRREKLKRERLKKEKKKIKKVQISIKLTESNTKLLTRNSIIIPICIGYSFLIHTGNIFINFYPSINIIGHKFGEFCNTRRRYFFKNKKKKKKK